MLVTDENRHFTKAELYSKYNEIGAGIGVISDFNITKCDCAGPSLHISYKEDGVQKDLISNDPTGRFIIHELRFVAALLSVKVVESSMIQQ